MTQPRTPATRLILSFTHTKHPAREHAHKQRDGAGKLRFGDDPGGFGLQITREALVCPACAAQRAGRTA